MEIIKLFLVNTKLIDAVFAAGITKGIKRSACVQRQITPVDPYKSVDIGRQSVEGDVLQSQRPNCCHPY